MKKLLILSIFFTCLFAHKLNVFVDYEKGSLYVSSYFASGSPCKNCIVKISSLDGKIIDENKTNAKGEYFKQIALKDFEVSVDAGGGHIAKEVFTSNEKDIQEEIKENTSQSELEKLKLENNKLKMRIKVLEKQVDIKEFAKMFFALFVIALIFMFLKRIKK